MMDYSKLLMCKSRRGRYMCLIQCFCVPRRGGWASGQDFDDGGARTSRGWSSSRDSEDDGDLFSRNRSFRTNSSRGRSFQSSGDDWLIMDDDQAGHLRGYKISALHANNDAELGGGVRQCAGTRGSTTMQVQGLHRIFEVLYLDANKPSSYVNEDWTFDIVVWQCLRRMSLISICFSNNTLLIQYYCFLLDILFLGL